MKNILKFSQKKILSGLLVLGILLTSTQTSFAGFWRTLDGMSASGILNPTQFLYGLGTDLQKNGIYGWGFGYGFGDFGSGYVQSSGGGGGSSSVKKSTAKTNLSGVGLVSGGEKNYNLLLSGSSLSGTTLTGSTQSGSLEQEISDSGATLSGSIFSGSTMSGGMLSGNVFGDELNINITPKNLELPLGEKVVIKAESRKEIVLATKNFEQIEKGVWHERYVEYLKNTDVLPENIVWNKPNESVSREKFLELFTYSMGYKNQLDVQKLKESRELKTTLYTRYKMLGLISALNKNGQITREEAIKVLLKSSNISVDMNVSETSFKDVKGSYLPYIEKARQMNIIVSADNFRPKDTLTQAEAAKIVSLLVTLTE